MGPQKKKKSQSLDLDLLKLSFELLKKWTREKTMIDLQKALEIIKKSLWASKVNQKKLDGNLDFESEPRLQKPHRPRPKPHNHTQPQHPLFILNIRYLDLSSNFLKK